MFSRISRLAPALGLLVAISLLLPASVSGLDASEQAIRGQVVKVLPAEIDGERIGVVLSSDRGVEQEPFTELRVVPGPDPNDWISIRLHGGPSAMAVGDVNGDGDDDVAVAHQLEGHDCPFPSVGRMPCGLIRIYDGPALLDGELEVLSIVKVLPTIDPCPPSSYNPATLALGDVTGDGRVELAFGQLGLLENTCSAVHVLPGDRLAGNVTTRDACAKLQGPQVERNEAPDHYGAHLELFGGRYLAIGAPYDNGTNDVPLAGNLSIHDVRDPCRNPGSASASPEPLAHLMGAVPGHLFGTDTAYADGTLWAAFKGGIRGFDVPSFEPTHTYNIPRSFPLDIAGDLNGDGRTELQAGPWIVQPADPDEELILQMVRFAEETFRGAVIGPDHVLSADKFGTRLWSITDLWNPFLQIAPEQTSVHAGGTLRVLVAEAVFLLPDPGEVQWTATGATIVERDETWVRIRADAPGAATVQATLEDTVATVQIPVHAPEDSVQVTGADTALVGHPAVVRIHAPDGSSIVWETPDGSPEGGAGSVIKTTYTREGQYNISIRVTLPDGAEASAEYPITVVKDPVWIEGPSRIDQGDLLGLSVRDPAPTHTYRWILEGQRTGVSALDGLSIQPPMGGWGLVNITVTARDAAGTPVGVGHHQAMVDNLPPVIQSMEVLPDPVMHLGLGGQASVADPGGDPVSLVWSVGDVIVGQNASFAVRLSAPGDVDVTLVATDAAGLSTTKVRSVEVRDLWESEARQTGPSSSDQDNETEGVLDVDEGTTDRLSPAPGAVAFTVLALAALAGRRKPPGEK